MMKTKELQAELDRQGCTAMAGFRPIMLFPLPGGSLMDVLHLVYVVITDLDMIRALEELSWI
jgi:hypothetical protein